MRSIKFLFFVSIFLVSISSCYATKQCENNYCNDFVVKPSFTSSVDSYKNHVVLNPATNPEKKGHLFEEIAGIADVITGGSSGGASTLYYDVEIKVLNKLVTRESFIKAQVTIINKGHIPDKDGALYTYLLSPSGNKYMEKKKEFEQVPPTCPGSSYDIKKDVCIYPNGTSIKPIKYVESIEAYLPTNASVGEWKYYAEYESRSQPLIKAWDSFAVVTGNIPLIIIGTSIIIFATRRKKDDKNQSKKP